MADPIKKEDSKDPVAELVNRLEEGKRATEKLDELEEQILDRIEQMVSGQGAGTAVSVAPADDSSTTTDQSGGNVFSDTDDTTGNNLD